MPFDPFPQVRGRGWASTGCRAHTGWSVWRLVRYRGNGFGREERPCGLAAARYAELAASARDVLIDGLAGDVEEPRNLLGLLVLRHQTKRLTFPNAETLNARSRRRAHMHDATLAYRGETSIKG